jgi:hypothetical protein
MSIGRVNLSNARPKDRLLKIDLLKPGAILVFIVVVVISSAGTTEVVVIVEVVVAERWHVPRAKVVKAESVKQTGGKLK